METSRTRRPWLGVAITTFLVLLLIAECALGMWWLAKGGPLIGPGV
jgi:hypothetical protein